MQERKYLFTVTIKGYSGHVDVLAVDKWDAINSVFNRYNSKYPEVLRKDYNAKKKKL